jgi:hypothetical protein
MSSLVRSWCSGLYLVVFGCPLIVFGCPLYQDTFGNVRSPGRDGATIYETMASRVTEHCSVYHWERIANLLFRAHKIEKISIGIENTIAVSGVITSDLYQKLLFPLFFVIMAARSNDDLVATLSSPAADFEAAISPIADPSSTESWSHVSSGTSSLTGGEFEVVQSVCHRCGWVSNVVPTQRGQGCRACVSGPISS